MWAQNMDINKKNQRIWIQWTLLGTCRFKRRSYIHMKFKKRAPGDVTGYNVINFIQPAAIMN